MTREPNNFDRLVGRNLRALRRAAKISQSDLAAGMTRRGAAISQPIFTRIERGERPLKFQEAMAAADVLGLTVTDLLHPPEPAGDELRAAHYLGELDRALITTQADLDAWLERQVTLYGTGGKSRQ